MTPTPDATACDDATVCNGRVVLRDDTLTGDRSGAIVGPSTAAAPRVVNISAPSTSATEAPVKTAFFTTSS